jgi:hypothetical protein
MDAPAPAPLKHALLYHAIHHSLYTEHRTWRDAYTAHEKAVKDFFAGSSRLMEFDIFERMDGWNQLCRFLGKPVPRVPYPNESWDANGAA